MPMFGGAPAPHGVPVLPRGSGTTTLCDQVAAQQREPYHAVPVIDMSPCHVRIKCQPNCKRSIRPLNGLVIEYCLAEVYTYSVPQPLHEVAKTDAVAISTLAEGTFEDSGYTSVNRPEPSKKARYLYLVMLRGEEMSLLYTQERALTATRHSESPTPENVCQERNHLTHASLRPDDLPTGTESTCSSFNCLSVSPVCGFADLVGEGVDEGDDVVGDEGSHTALHERRSTHRAAPTISRRALRVLHPQART
ncbi:hypothetical protein EDB83DRAFT_2637959 [Lactarius deliciosus]|nr:hypothetical protein EDB83DRAFT_2637959 [Lactarius deliciosus]